MATVDKLTYLQQTKADIKTAIEGKGVTVPTNTTFRNYATKVSEIEQNTAFLNYANRVSADGGTIENTALASDFTKGLTNESLAILPSGKKAGKLHSQLPINGTGDFTVSRNSTATYKDANGIIRTAQANVPRIEDGALLLEPQSTNLITYSDGDLTTYPIKGGNISNALVPISFFNNSVQIISGNSYIYKDYTPTIGVTYTLSLFMEMEDGSLPVIGASTTTGDFSIIMDGIIVSGVVNRIGTTNIYRITASNTAKDNRQTFGIVKYPLQSVKGFKFSGIQLEVGSVATSYIPTVATTVTRVADVATVTTPVGVTSITETINGVEQTPITTIPSTYTIPNGKINKIIMQ
jgi:hypothetical protein